MELLALFLDAVYLSTRPRGEQEGVLVAWGYTRAGHRDLVAVRLGERQSYKDWLDLGRDLACWGLQEPWLVVSDGAPGLLEASEPEHAERRLRALVGELQREYPSAAACLADDLPARCVNPRYPPQLRKRLRSTNLLERSLEEVQRRVTVIGRLPGEPAA